MTLHLDNCNTHGGRCCDIGGRPLHHLHQSKQPLQPYPIVLIAFGLLLFAIASAQPPTAGSTKQEVIEDGQSLAMKNDGWQLLGSDVETQRSSRLPSDMVDMAGPVTEGRRTRQIASTRKGQQLRRRSRQTAPVVSSSRRDQAADIGTIMLDAKYPLAGFDDDIFDDSSRGMGALSALDESEIGRRLAAGSLLDATTTAAAHLANKDETSESEAAFSGALETNVTASLGQTAFLRCRLKNSQHQVTWIRIRDWHILTSGVLTYTADARFRVKHSESEASEWTLEIKFLQKRDEGTYYCQIPTRTGAAVHAFHLHIASPQAVILGGQVSHVDILTPSLTLVCIVDNTPDPPQVIFWYHNGTLLTDGQYPEAGVGGGSSGLISSHLTLTPSRTMSMLTLHHIQHIHSGNYTCRAPNAEPDTTQLFVTQRHEQAAVHRSSCARRLSSTSWMMVIAALIGHVLTIRRKHLYVLVD
ncbi:hypothetical protein GHT06_017483 [Daphnia sinensis]|uniref:Ig-like domain-containing protein n=1 Tax=Daphnia sinensis TaxID=1820382 RepID=A0AAD5PW71_9CRUS|nr:hypothetical protein GHT06_017483 [Daphnia sinensis]